MNKNIFSSIIIILSLLIIGFAVWFILPLSLFGAVVIADQFNLHTTAKSHVKEYVQKTYGEKMEIIELSFEGEARVDTLVASVYEKERKVEYTIYYDLKNDKILFDEIQFEKKGNDYLKELSVPTVGKEVRKENLVKAIAEQEKMMEIYEEEIEKTNFENASTLTSLEAHIEKEYENLGALLNTLDSLLIERRE